MRLEDQVTSRELSKRLKELGVKQESLFYWINSVMADWQLTDSENAHDTHSDPDGISWMDEPDTTSAFTVAELGEMLPDSLKDGNEIAVLDFWKEEDCSWEASYSPSGERSWACEKGKTEADARARLLIYLLENRLMEVPS